MKTESRCVDLMAGNDNEKASESQCIKSRLVRKMKSMMINNTMLQCMRSLLRAQCLCRLVCERACLLARVRVYARARRGSNILSDIYIVTNYLHERKLYVLTQCTV